MFIPFCWPTLKEVNELKEKTILLYYDATRIYSAILWPPPDPDLCAVSC